MAYPLSVTELTLRVGEAPLPSMGCCPPLPPTILGLQPALHDARGNVGHGSRRRTGNRGRPKGSKHNTHSRRPGDGVNRRGDPAASSGGGRDHKMRHTAASDARGSVGLPQHLLLTPFAPLPWDKMVQNRETPHFFLVPSTPVKATWLSDPDFISSLTGKRKKKPKNGKDGHGIAQRTDDYDANNQAFEKSDEMSNDYWEDEGVNQGFDANDELVSENDSESGAPLENKVSADETREDNPDVVDNDGDKDETVLSVQNILETYSDENYQLEKSGYDDDHSDHLLIGETGVNTETGYRNEGMEDVHHHLSRYDDDNSGHALIRESGVNIETGHRNEGMEEVHHHLSSDQPPNSFQGSSQERRARQTVGPNFERVSHHKIPSTPKLTNHYQRGGKIINEEFLDQRQGVPGTRDHISRTDKYTLKHHENLSGNEHVGNSTFPATFDQTHFESMDYRSPTSYHIQSFSGHSLRGNSHNSGSVIEHDSPAMSHSKHVRNILQYPQGNGNDREYLHRSDHSKDHMEFTELDAVNRNRTRFPYSNIQNNIHRQNKNVRANYGGIIEPRIVNDGLSYPSSYTRSLSSKSPSNVPIRMNTKGSAGIINPTGEINIFHSNSHRQQMNSAGLPVKNHAPKRGFGWSQDVYQSASAVHNIRFQDNPDGTQDAMNLFEVRFKPSTPITYIQYTTRPTSRPSTQKSSTATSKYQYNPFFQNFGPFPDMGINANVKNLHESESQDDLVFVTPNSNNNTDSARVEETDSEKVGTNRNGYLHNLHDNSKGVYFIQAESTTTMSGISDSERMVFDDGWNVTDFSSWPTLHTESVEIDEQLLNTTIDTIIDLQWGRKLSNDSNFLNENQSEYSIIPTVLNSSAGEELVEVHQTALLPNTSTNSKDGKDTNLRTSQIATNYATETSSSIAISDEINISDSAETQQKNASENSVHEIGSEDNGVQVPSKVAPETHRKGGAFLDALVTLIREASSDNDSLKELLPPFSVLEVGVGESILSPDLTAEEAGSSTGAGDPDVLVKENFNNSVLGPMLQIGIILGIVIIAAVLMFHSHHIRKECCSKEKKERLRQLKKRYKNSREDDFSSVELPPRSRRANNNRKSAGRRNVFSGDSVNSRGADTEDGSDDDSNYARVIDVTL